jgi:PAS domain S-box-containing protein
VDTRLTTGAETPTTLNRVDDPELDGILSRALAAAQVGIWSYDRTRREYWDQTTKALFGISTEAEPTTELFLTCVHPDDRRRYAQALASAIDPTGGGHYECDFRIRRPDTGEERWLSSRGQSEFAGGQFVRIIGVVHDVTAQKRSEEAARAGEERVRGILENLRERELQLAQFVEDAPVAIAMFDTNMRYMAASRRYSMDFGTPPPSQLIGRTRQDIVHNLPERWRQIELRVLAGEELSADEDRLPRAGGRLEWVRWSVKPWRHADGRVGGILSFSEIITDEVEARHALAASEQRFRGLFEHAATGIALVGLNGEFQQCNPAFAKMLGYTEEEMRGINLRSLVHPDDLSALREKNDKLLAGEIRSFEITNRYLRKDGSVRWSRRFVSLLRDAEDRPRSVMVLATDMTERIAYEQKIGLLLREVTHRAKNMLGVVQAIARSTATSGAEDFQARFAERVRALAAAHDLLVNNEWQSVDLADLISSQLAHVGHLAGSRILINGPSLRISGAAAQTLGMALHELTANAVAYGALSSPTGTVTIAWRDEGDRFTMDWVERGGPPVVQVQRSGFGTIVMDRMTRMTLGGEVKIERAPEGLSWHLRCPLAKIAPTPLEPK